MKKSSKSSLKERSLDIFLQHENQASYKFSKKKKLHLAKNRSGAERVKIAATRRKTPEEALRMKFVYEG